MSEVVPLPVLSARNIHLRRGAKTLLSGLDLEVPEGAVVALEAEAGRGATSLLKVCAGLIPPDEGTVEVGGVDLHRSPYARRREAKRKIGFVFQEAALIQNLTVFDNVALPLRYHAALPESDVEDRVLEILRALDLEEVADDLPAALGLQEAHAASLARALGVEPEILIFDDYFSRLSRDHAAEIWEGVRSRVGGRVTAVIGSTDRARIPAEWTALHVLRDGRLSSDASSIGGRG